MWLVLAWALWLGLLAADRARLLRSLRRRLRAARVALAARARLAAVRARRRWRALAAAVVVGEAVAATARPTPTSTSTGRSDALAAGIERLIPPRRRRIDYRFGALDLGTQPMEPAIRFFLVRHGDRVLAHGSFPRLGSYYELYTAPCSGWCYLTDGSHRARAHDARLPRAFRSPWGRELISAWVQRVPPRRARPHAKPALPAVRSSGARDRH